MSCEIWKPIPNYERYQVSNLGNVKGPRGMLKHRKGKHKYHLVSLSNNGKGKTFTVHSLVLTAFVSPRPEGLLGLHKDDNQDNNCVDNLYWGTYKQNAQDALRNNKFPIGSRHGLSKLTEDQVSDIRKRYKTTGYNFSNAKDLAKEFGVTPVQIVNIVRGECWSGSPKKKLRTTSTFTIDGITNETYVWARLLKIPKETVGSRIRRGITDPRIVFYKGLLPKKDNTRTQEDNEMIAKKFMDIQFKEFRSNE